MGQKAETNQAQIGIKFKVCKKVYFFAHFLAHEITNTSKRSHLNLLRIYAKTLKRNLINQFLLYHICFPFAIVLVQKSIQFFTEGRREDIRMWCVLHVKNGSETAVEVFVSGLLQGDVKVRCFHLTRCRRNKYGGVWQTVPEDLLPGYVFIDTDQPQEMCRALKRSGKRRMLFSCDDFISTLKENERSFMESITDQDGRIVLSKVSMAPDGEISCLSGPLMHVSHLVRKMDLHRRIAEVETNFLGERHVLYLGIDIVGQASDWRQRTAV